MDQLKWNRWAIVDECAAPDKALLDFDGPLPRDLLERIWKLAAIMGIRPRWIRQDRTRRGWHVVIVWNRKFEPATLTAMQAILGSDPARESLNLARCQCAMETPEQRKYWNILYRPGGKL